MLSQKYNIFQRRYKIERVITKFFIIFLLFYFYLIPSFLIYIIIKKIPPLLGFYAKLFIINSIAYTNIYIAILAIITSVISCVRYLNIIQITNFKFNNIVPMGHNTLLIKLNPLSSYIISLFTLF